MRKFIFSLIFCAIAAAGFGQTFKVASFNIRYQNQGDVDKGNGWSNRCPVIVSLIEFNNFDIFGAQEVLHAQLGDLEKGLPDYGHVGVGRDDGVSAGEYAPIFYKREMFELLSSGTFWLSPQTESPNVGWDAALPRICSWGRFKQKSSGFEFMFFNLHMDHVGVEARRESAKLVLKKIEQMSNGLPVVLTGDFNVDQNNETYDILAQSGIVFDSYQVAEKRYALNGTFNAFNVNALTESRIDHIFLSSHFVTKRYGVLTDTYRSARAQSVQQQSGDFPKEVTYNRNEVRLPSDHFPIVAIIEVKK